MEIRNNENKIMKNEKKYFSLVGWLEGWLERLVGKVGWKGWLERLVGRFVGRFVERLVVNNINRPSPPRPRKGPLDVASDVACRRPCQGKGRRMSPATSPVAAQPKERACGCR